MIKKIASFEFRGGPGFWGFFETVEACKNQDHERIPMVPYFEIQVPITAKLQTSLETA